MFCICWGGYNHSHPSVYRAITVRKGKAVFAYNGAALKVESLFQRFLDLGAVVQVYVGLDKGIESRLLSEGRSRDVVCTGKTRSTS